MPNVAAVKKIPPIISLVILVLSLGAASTSLGLIKTNIAIYDSTPAYKLSLACAIIPTICLAMLTVIELVSVAFKIEVQAKTVKILQVGLYICSIVSLFITMAAVSVRWAENCRKHVFECHNFSISGPIIAAPICAGISFLLAVGCLTLFVIQHICKCDTRPRPQVQNESEDVELLQ